MAEQELIIQRIEPDKFSVILKLNSALEMSIIYDADVKELYMKGDYFFYTKKSTKVNYIFYVFTCTNIKMLHLLQNNDDLYISYKFKVRHLCIFDTELDRRSYFIADVTDNRAFVAIGHSDIISHLYVSEDLKDIRLNNGNNLQFILSLENVLCYFPNNTWIDSWLQYVLIAIRFQLHKRLYLF